jgi:hypothetical protein
MKSTRLPSGADLYAQEYNALRSDAVAAAFLHPHQQLGALALGTNLTNGQTLTLDINGSNVVLTGKTGTLVNPGDFAIQSTATLTMAVIWNGLRNPTTTTSTFVALSSANATLVQYLAYELPSGGTTITPYSLNNSTYSPLTSFSASFSGGSGNTWTAQTLQLYVQEGAFYIGSTRVIFLGGSTPTFTAPVANPRIDIVTIDSSGTLAITQGSENVSPSAPNYPANKAVLCEVYNVVGETALYDVDNQQTGQGYISNDVRSVVHWVYINSQSQLAPGVAILDPGSEAQGDILYYSGSAWVLLAPGTSGQILATQGPSANPHWITNTAFTKMKGGQNTWAAAASSATQTIAHGLGIIPQFVSISALAGTEGGGGTGFMTSNGTYDGTTMFLAPMTFPTTDYGS